VLAKSIGQNLYASASSLTSMAPSARSSTGGGTPHNNMQPYLTVLLLHRLQGVFRRGPDLRPAPDAWRKAGPPRAHGPAFRVRAADGVDLAVYRGIIKHRSCQEQSQSEAVIREKGSVVCPASNPTTGRPVGGARRQATADALLALHKRYANLVYSMAWRVLQDVGLAEEVTQDVFMKLWRQGQRYDPARAVFPPGY